MSGNGITKLEFNYQGFNEMRTSPEVEAALEKLAKRAVEFAEGVAGEGAEFEYSKYVGQTRVRFTLHASNRAAKKAEAEDKALTQGFGSIQGG